MSGRVSAAALAGEAARRLAASKPAMAISARAARDDLPPFVLRGFLALPRDTVNPPKTAVANSESPGIAAPQAGWRGRRVPLAAGAAGMTSAPTAAASKPAARLDSGWDPPDGALSPLV